MSKCKHEFVRSGYGNDLICAKCGYAAMQATMPVSTSITTPIVQPILRETMEVPIATGDSYGRITVYKDTFEKELFKSLGIPSFKMGL